MVSNRRSLVLVALTLQMLMVGVTASPLAEAVNPMGDVAKMTADLEAAVTSNDDSTVIPLIYQHHSPVTDADRRHIDAHGFTLPGDAPPVDGA